MHWIFYAARETSLTRFTAETIANYVPAHCLDKVYGLKRLDGYLRRPLPYPSRMFLLIRTLEELGEISRYNEMIFGMSCLVGVTDHFNEELINAVFQLHPRYIALLPKDISFLESMLQKSCGDACGPITGLSLLDEAPSRQRLLPGI